MDTNDRVIAVIKQSELKTHRQITSESRLFEDLEFDSLGVMQLTAAIEDEFDIDIPIPKLVHISTVKDLSELIAKLTETRA